MKKITLVSFLCSISLVVFCQAGNAYCDSPYVFNKFNKFVVSTIERTHKNLYANNLNELNSDYLAEVEFNIDSTGFFVSCESINRNNPKIVISYVQHLFLSNKNEKWIFDDTSSISRRIHCFIYLKCLRLSDIERLAQMDKDNEAYLNDTQNTKLGPKLSDFNANSCFIFLSY